MFVIPNIWSLFLRLNLIWAHTKSLESKLKPLEQKCLNQDAAEFLIGCCTYLINHLPMENQVVRDTRYLQFSKNEKKNQVSVPLHDLVWSLVRPLEMKLFKTILKMVLKHNMIYVTKWSKNIQCIKWKKSQQVSLKNQILVWSSKVTEFILGRGLRYSWSRSLFWK